PRPGSFLTILLPDPWYRAARYLLNLACDPGTILRLLPLYHDCPHDTNPVSLTSLTTPSSHPSIPLGSGSVIRPSRSDRDLSIPFTAGSSRAHTLSG
ncbi:unnamed protein product, partial [Staurois parvus]